jgi:hypothetical protein
MIYNPSHPVDIKTINVNKHKNKHSTIIQQKYFKCFPYFRTVNSSKSCLKRQLIIETEIPGGNFVKVFERFKLSGTLKLQA